jgi:hypothetical protein
MRAWYHPAIAATALVVHLVAFMVILEFPGSSVAVVFIARSCVGPLLRSARHWCWIFIFQRFSSARIEAVAACDFRSDISSGRGSGSGRARYLAEQKSVSSSRLLSLLRKAQTWVSVDALQISCPE